MGVYSDVVEAAIASWSRHPAVRPLVVLVGIGLIVWAHWDVRNNLRALDAQFRAEIASQRDERDRIAALEASVGRLETIGAERWDAVRRELGSIQDSVQRIEDLLMSRAKTGG